MTLFCDIGVSEIIISDQTESTCNEINFSFSSSQLVITGNSSTHSAKIDNANLTVVFSTINVKAMAPIMISSSSVFVVLSGSNQLNSSSPVHAGLECSSGSNLSIASISDGSLFVYGGLNSSGIGTGANGTCSGICILNGSLSASGGTGIGSGPGTSMSSSQVGEVIIQSGHVIATGLSGAGIGNGDAQYGNSTVVNLMIMNGNITSTSALSYDGFGSGIGSGRGLYGNSSVVNLTIMNGNITSTSSLSGSSYGSGIGSGEGSSGKSIVVNLTIMNGNITSTSSLSGSGYGSGIGSGYGSSGNSTVVNLTIMNGNITPTSSLSSTGYGSGIGSGYIAGLTPKNDHF
jgi:hypothetical protein